MVSSCNGLIIINIAQFADLPQNTPYKATRLIQNIIFINYHVNN